MAFEARTLSIYKPEYLQAVKDRLLSKKVVDSHGCWIFTGSRNHQGYGRLGVAEMGPVRVHCVSYMLFCGDIPASTDVCHKCNVKPCFNPDHLYLASRSENVQHAVRDRLTKHHKMRGARITDEQAREIHREAKAATRSQAAIAKDYGVDQQIVSRILNGKAFRWALSA